MNRQIPPYVVTAAIVAAVCLALYVVGKSTPTVTNHPLIGKSAPPLEGRDAKNQPVTLASLKGKVVLLNIWATWCGPCRAEMPDLIRLQNKYAAKDFTVIGVTGEDEVDVLEGFARDNALNYPLWHADAKALSPLGFSAYPSTYIIDREGVVRSFIVGQANEAKFEELISPHL